MKFTYQCNKKLEKNNLNNNLKYILGIQILVWIYNTWQPLLTAKRLEKIHENKSNLKPCWVVFHENDFKTNCCQKASRNWKLPRHRVVSKHSWEIVLL